MSVSFNVGDTVAVIGYGAGTVASLDEQSIRISMPGDASPSVRVAIAEIGEYLRAPIDLETAQRTLGRLCKRVGPKETRTQPALRASRDARRLSFDAQVELLRLRYRAPKLLIGHEQLFLESAAKAVLGELGVVLGKPAAVVLAAVKLGKPGIEPPAVKHLPRAPTLPLAGATFLRSFWLGPRALVGENPGEDDSGALALSVLPGAWHAYRIDTTSEGPDSGKLDGMLALHHDFVLSTPFDPAALRVRAARLDLSRNSLGLLDAAALKDPLLGPESLSETRDDEGGYADRGVAFSTWEAGAHEVRVDRKPKAMAVFISRVVG